MSLGETCGADTGCTAELRVVEQTGSTNDDCRALALEGAPHGTAVAAHLQTAGRGRRGHTWVSPRGNLYLSVVLRPNVAMQNFVGLSAVCALGILAALREDAGVQRAALKWPNDVIWGDGKLAGILVEAGAGAQGPFAVCGVGVNLAPADGGRDGTFDSPHALPRVCVADAVPGGEVPSFERLAAALRSRICAAVDDWARQVRAGGALAGPLAPVLNEYFDAVPLLGHPVGVYAPTGERVATGMFAGVDCWGRATVRLADGQTVEYAAEQASLRPLI